MRKEERLFSWHKAFCARRQNGLDLIAIYSIDINVGVIGRGRLKSRLERSDRLMEAGRGWPVLVDIAGLELPLRKQDRATDRARYEGAADRPIRDAVSRVIGRGYARPANHPRARQR